MSFEIVESADAYLVKTPNFETEPIPEEEAVSRLPVDSPILKALESPYVDASFGLRDGEVTVRQWSYSKEKYGQGDVERLTREKLLKCVRCSSISERVGEKRNLAYVNYMQVGKEVLIAGVGGTLAGAVHVMFLQPQFAGQQIIPGVPTVSVVDIVIGFVVGVLTKMYAKTAIAQLAGYGVAGFLTGLGILQLVLPAFGIQAAAPRYVAPQSVFAPSAIAQVPRATYLAPAGVVVNKHGSVPEIAPGTFG